MNLAARRLATSSEISIDLPYTAEHFKETILDLIGFRYRMFLPNELRKHGVVRVGCSWMGSIVL